MKKENFPIPTYFKDKPITYVRHGNYMFAYVRDGNYDIKMSWDGDSAFLTDIEVIYRENLPEKQ